MFASGLAVVYSGSILIAKPGNSAEEGDGTDVGPQLNEEGKVVGTQELSSNIKMGMRFPSFQVLNQSDARPWQFCHFLESDGRFRIILFAGNLKDQTQWQRVHKVW